LCAIYIYIYIYRYREREREREREIYRKLVAPCNNKSHFVVFDGFFYIQKSEVAFSPKKSVSIYITTRCRNPED
jgi:hypothetical protein